MLHLVARRNSSVHCWREQSWKSLEQAVVAADMCSFAAACGAATSSEAQSATTAAAEPQAVASSSAAEAQSTPVAAAAANPARRLQPASAAPAGTPSPSPAAAAASAASAASAAVAAAPVIAARTPRRCAVQRLLLLAAGRLLHVLGASDVLEPQPAPQLIAAAAPRGYLCKDDRLLGAGLGELLRLNVAS